MSDDAVAFAVQVLRSMLRLAPTAFPSATSEWLSGFGIPQAVADHDTASIFDWLVPLLAYQGIGDVAASRFAARHAPISWHQIDDAMRVAPSCSRLRSHWHYHGCRYRKAAATCAEPAHINQCFLPSLPLRKGALNQAAVGLWLFLREVCSGDVVGWLDMRHAAADTGLDAAERGRLLAQAVIEPLCNVVGTGSKIWSMILADLFLAADHTRERWVAAGASMVAVDTLVHAVLHRTDILRRCAADHAYGAACYAPGGRADVVRAIAAAVDAREFNADFPSYFPRFVEKAIWHFAAENGLDICNGRRIDDGVCCRQVFCPCFAGCDRLALSGRLPPGRRLIVSGLSR